ncbi:diguanylate cyclase domain-containing protein [Ferrimonas sp. SCSIO 43195]|uniref:sensor domain-containing diguanylate cyclase n=1 Tax=Ferrimonas sp. SCSIO 43195 TaxID=2822844 RepID=UPI0020765C2F|nr:diguanylate cyclase [Ferrimonas sp. SCSIO 43195]USD39187.1 GGDEF domain-containing protein [Ferrimonas sp. SCSIO 43195]
MKQLSYALEDNQALTRLLDAPELHQAADAAHAMLIQLYSASQDSSWCRDITAALIERFPAAQLVGASTTGEIQQGRTLTGHTVVGFTLFEDSDVHSLSLPCQRGEEHGIGRQLRSQLDQFEHVAGVLLLATTISVDANDILAELNRTPLPFPVFGGGAADYGTMSQSLLMHQGRCLDSGVVAVVFCGRNLHLSRHTYLGWRPLSKTMTATEVKNRSLKLIDNRPAFEVLSRYLNIADDDNFYLNSLEFPLMIQRNQQLIARVPVGVARDRSIEFIADIRQGEKLRLGYGDPKLIIRDAQQVHRSMAQFGPQAVFLYSCGCRRFLMQDDVELETLPFQSIAPTFGFYTYGEFFAERGQVEFLNSTMVAIGMREGAKSDHRRPPLQSEPSSIDAAMDDPYANQHIRIIERLVHFVDAVTAELQQTSDELQEVTIVDKLTQLPNRYQMDTLLARELAHAQRAQHPFSLILVDIDQLRKINERHGRLVGDEVVAEIAQLLATHTRRTDIVGRWQGGTFMVILPDTELQEAKVAAIKLYAMIGQTHFTHGDHCSASLGVSCHQPGFTLHQTLNRINLALQQAKSAGGNQIQTQA